MNGPRRTITEMDVNYSKGSAMRVLPVVVSLAFSLLMLILYFSLSHEPPRSTSAVETNHLIVRTLGDSKLTVSQIATGLEADYADLYAKFNLQRTAKVFVDIYPNIEEFNKFIGSQSLEFPNIPVAMYENRLSFIMPDNQNADYDMDTLKKAIMHEWAHFLAGQVQSAPNTRWLSEGVASYYGGQKSNPKEIKAAISKGYPTIDELNDSRYADCRVLGYTLSEFIAGKWGEDSLLELLAFNGNTQQALKISQEDFEKQWHQFIEQNYLK